MGGQEIAERGTRDGGDVLSADPAVMGGRTVFAGTRVPVEVLFENLADGLSVDEIVDSYPTLDKRQVIALLEDAARHYATRR